MMRVKYLQYQDEYAGLGWHWRIVSKKDSSIFADSANSYKSKQEAKRSWRILKQEIIKRESGK